MRLKPPDVPVKGVPPSAVPPWKVKVKVSCKPEQFRYVPGGVPGGPPHGQFGAPDGTSLGVSALGRKGPSAYVSGGNEQSVNLGTRRGAPRGSGSAQARKP